MALRFQRLQDCLAFVCSLDLVNAEMSPEKYWRVSKSQDLEVGDGGGGGGRGGGEGAKGGGGLYLTLHCHRQNDFCIKIGSDESHFNVSLIVRGKVARQCPQTTTCEEKGGPKRGIEPTSSAYKPSA